MSARAADPSPFRIRRATPRDLPALVDLENRSFAGDRISARQFGRHVASASACVLVAMRSRTLAGSAIVFLRAGSDIARLYSLAVDAAFRGQGCAAALLEAAERTARARGARRLRLEVRADNVAAQRLYENRGYRRFGERRRYYEDGCDAWRYERALTGRLAASAPSRRRPAARRGRRPPRA